MVEIPVQGWKTQLNSEPQKEREQIFPSVTFLFYSGSQRLHGAHSHWGGWSSPSTDSMLMNKV